MITAHIMDRALNVMERRAPDVITKGLAFMKKDDLVRAYILRANILQKTLHFMGRPLNIMRRAPDVTIRGLDFLKTGFYEKEPILSALMLVESRLLEHMLFEIIRAYII